MFKKPLEENTLGFPSKKWKKKYECRRGKGLHDWYPSNKPILWSASIYVTEGKHKGGSLSSNNWQDLVLNHKGKLSIIYWVEWKCKACGKKDTEWYPNIKKKFNHSMNNLYK